MNDNAASEFWAEKIEEEGYQACLDGEAPWANPYLFGTSSFTMWERGWDCANAANGARAWC